MSAPPLLELRGVAKDYPAPGGSLRVLHEASLTVAPGESMAVTGPSGSGKSTLLGLMAGLERPSAGTLLWRGRDMTALSEDELAAWRRVSVGFIFQNHRLVGALSALENVMLPLEICGVPGPQARERALGALAALGLAERAEHRPHQLSGGEQQRVAIARAYVHAPALILADEPTGALDGDTAAAVLSSFLALNAEKGAALVLVTHNPEVAARLGRTVRLARGRLA
ncbi:MAG: ABC transporter ATP-binding protein [Elusimicrobia bacterium]|nr:ABC transporter ATP-binding protein [Elusimicrobiota bacterium]